MKNISFLSILFCISLIMITSCKSINNNIEEVEKVELNLSTATLFARQIESSVSMANPDFFNKAFDENDIKKTISDNSIIYSSFDTDFGNLFFESNFKLGDEAVSIIDHGGDVRAIHTYEQNGEYHIIVRTYRDFHINIDDYVLDTVNNQIKIKDGFNYNFSTSFSNKARYNMLFNILNKTNSEGVTSLLIEANNLLNAKKTQEARKLLIENKELLKEYPIYWQLYIQSVYESDKKGYLQFLDNLKVEGFDERSILLHKLLFFTHQGKVEETEQIVNEIIEYTGDDPIYLFFFGLANFNAGEYESALYCYENVTTGMPMIWDIWHCKLECYYKLNWRESFDDALELGKDLYGIDDGELARMVEKNFTKFSGK